MEDQEAADSVEDHAAVEQAAPEEVASAADIAVAHAEAWAEVCITDRIIMDRIGTDHVGTDQDLFLSLEDQDITARVAVTALTVRTMAVA